MSELDYQGNVSCENCRQAYPAPILACCQHLNSLICLVRACATLSDDTSCAQVLELQLKGWWPSGDILGLQE